MKSRVGLNNVSTKFSISYKLTNMKLIVCEKPSVARDIARVLGIAPKGAGFFSGHLDGEQTVISWCIGHLIGISDPGEMNSQWKAWSLAALPIIPEVWKLKVLPKTKKQFSILKKLLKDTSLKEIVCATDAGREGELIFRLLYQHAKCRAPVKRLWVSSLTDEAIKEGFRNLKDASEYDSLYETAFSRAKADWLVGMNFSRFYSIRLGSNFSVGRVQTPTLKLIVHREDQIERFVEKKYLSIVATFSRPESKSIKSKMNNGEINNSEIYNSEMRREIEPVTDSRENVKAFERDQSTYTGELVVELDNLPEEIRQFLPDFLYLIDADKTEKKKSSSKFPVEPSIFQYFASRLSNANITINSVSTRKKEERPPYLHDLTELQREANRVFGFSASETLSLSQALYERHKIISYPRTDSRYLTNDLKLKTTTLKAKVVGHYQSVLGSQKLLPSLPSRFFDDGKVKDHHAIIPTGNFSALGRLSPKEGKVFDLICRRFLMGFCESYLSEITSVTTSASFRGAKDLYLSRGTIVTRKGWKGVSVGSNRPSKIREDEGQTLPSWIKEGLSGLVGVPSNKEKVTPPPKRYTDASLLTAMETAGKLLDDAELAQSLFREKGIGTPATRASIVETLIKREYIERKGKAFYALRKGRALIAAVHPELSSVALTGEWEFALEKIREGSASSEVFDKEIAQLVSRLLVSAPNNLKRPVGFSNAEAISASLSKGVESKSYLEESHSGVSFTHKFKAHDAPTLKIEMPVASMKMAKSAEAVSLNLATRTKPVFYDYELKTGQKKAIDFLRHGQDVFSVFPTGYGKSLIYQVAGFELEGPTIVVSPLIALMNDQVLSLQKMGVRAVQVSGQSSKDFWDNVVVRFNQGQIDYLFISPERASRSSVVEELTRAKVGLLVIDEAHCVSTWGSDFRPSYRKLSRLVSSVRPAPICLLSATVRESVFKDVCQNLRLSDVKLVLEPGFSNNNRIVVRQVELSERISAICQILEQDSNKPAVVYVPTRKIAEELSEKLSFLGVTTFFHAGVSLAQKDLVQQAFLDDKIDIIVATIAFGMGINKPNVRSVIHYTVPMDIDGYAQEIGRAGRDGERSSSILFYERSDRQKLLRRHSYLNPTSEVIESFISTKKVFSEKFLGKLTQKQQLILSKAMSLDLVYKEGKKIVKRVQKANWQKNYDSQNIEKISRLNDMCSYAESVSICRQVELLRYFFPNQKDSFYRECQNCDLCLGTVQGERPANVNHSAAGALAKHYKPLPMGCRPGPKPIEIGTKKSTRETSPNYAEMLKKYIVDHGERSSTLVFQQFAKPMGMSRQHFWSTVSKLEKNSEIKVFSEQRTVRGKKIRVKSIGPA